MQLKHLIGNYCPLCWIKVLAVHLTYITMSLLHHCRLWAQHLPTPLWAAPAYSICTQMTHNVNWVCTIANKHHPYKSTWPDNHWKLFKRVHCTVACCMFTNCTRQDILIQLPTATQETETNTSFGLFPGSRFAWLLWLVYRCHTLKHKTNQQHNTDTVQTSAKMRAGCTVLAALFLAIVAGRPLGCRPGRCCPSLFTVDPNPSD